MGVSADLFHLRPRGLAPRLPGRPSINKRAPKSPSAARHY